MTGALLASWLLMIAAQTPAVAMNADAPYAGDRFAVTVEEIADGVHVLRREPSWRFPVQANTAIIVNAEDVVIVDGGYGAHAERVVREVRRITDKPVSVIINTHWHQDHNLGHYVFMREWPAARVIAHHETRAEMVGRDDFLGPPATSLDEALAQLREQGEQFRADNRPELAAYVADVIEGLPLSRAEFARARLVPAHETFSERLVLHRSGRRIELLHFGPANTKGDAIVWLPEERIVIAGDVVVRPTPYGFGSRPRSWARVLRSINDLDYLTLVPGHGDLQRDKDYVSRLAAMMTAIADQACAAVSAGADDAEDVGEAIDWAPFDESFAGGDPLLGRLFQMWFKRPIAEGALAEIREDPAHACG